MANPICYVEFWGSNAKGKSEFFREVFGWECVPHGENYAMWTTGEGEMGGGLGSDESMGQCTVAYIQVADIEATLKSIEANGGSTIIPKKQISEDHGYFAHFKDCCGTIVGLWSKS
jgi:predicted enzyme related to lactoylglutathione lyase